MNPLLPRKYILEDFYFHNREVFTVSYFEKEIKNIPQPGQFNMIYEFGQGESAISVSGIKSVKGGFLIEHTIRSVGNVTSSLSEKKRGNEIFIRGPYGKPWPMNRIASDIFFVSGGIGLAPLKPLIEKSLTEPVSSHSIHVFCGFRSNSDLIFKDSLIEWFNRGVDLKISFDQLLREDLVKSTIFENSKTMDSGNGSQSNSIKKAEIKNEYIPIHAGFVTQFIQSSRPKTNAPLTFICGPEVMMNAVIQEFELKKLSTENIHLSMERHMKCAIKQCGRCQYREYFVCHDGPVFSYNQVESHLKCREL